MISVDRINELVQKGNDVLKTHTPNPSGIIGFPTLNSAQFTAWRSQVLNYLNSNLPSENQYLISFKENVDRGYKSSVETGIGLLKSIIEDINLGFLEQVEQLEFEKNNPVDNILIIFERFHLVVRQLRDRYDNRVTLDVTDEYDVQDLLHSLLTIHYDDIRPEEWTPSYAGKSSRMDFLLKDFKIVLEIKKTRKGLTAKEVGSQLIEDIARYEKHQDCETLLCFIYDPEGLISNPRGLENDLSRETTNLRVKVFVRP
jgi:hypothetical protein